ncbi:unnamed protein product [Spirodela intermedia]|uniref:Uncharacterized protein n=1 Tax=Spirodela intermedia TaxID=51605 RepID=A0A7I8KXC1_SPIIN|nr:unnamed protein product [Spirodela intermedia]
MEQRIVTNSTKREISQPRQLSILSIKNAKRILEDVVVTMKGCSFPADFVVSEINSHSKFSEMPIIFGRSIFNTTQINIDVPTGIAKIKFEEMNEMDDVDDCVRKTFDNQEIKYSWDFEEFQEQFEGVLEEAENTEKLEELFGFKENHKKSHFMVKGVVLGHVVTLDYIRDLSNIFQK